MKTIYIYIFLLVLSFTALKAQTIREYGQHLDFVNPGWQTSYEVILPVGATLSMITWYVSNGSFSQTSDVTTKQGRQTVVDVFWKNPACSNGNPPKGNIYAQIDYVLAGRSRSDPSNSVSQNILSYKGVYPPALLTDKPLTIPMGENKIRLYLANQFLLPYTYTDGRKIEVSEFEWTLPEGWAVKNIFVSNSPDINITTDYFNEGTVKIRGVNSNALGDYTNYSQITFKRNFSFLTYPSSIKYGEIQSYTYKVTPVEGVTYEWKLPDGWTQTSGGNTNTVTLTKSACAISADVQVRLKVGIKYSQWYVSPNRTVLPPDITIPAIEQFRDVNVATNIPNSQIQSFSVSGDGVSTIGGQGTNTLVCRFDKTGSKELTIAVTLKGCGSSYSFKKTVQVSAIKLAISGADVVCPYDNPHSYSISDLPAEANVTWSSTNHLSTTNNKGSSCSFSAGKSGIGSVKADINIRGTNINISRNIEISTVPGEPGINPYITYSTDRDYLSLNIHTPNLYGIREFMWNAESIGGGGSTYYSRTGPGGYYWTIPTGRYTVEVRIVTQCGHLMLTTTVGGYSRAYPNPVEQTLFVEIDNPIESTPSALSASSRQIQEYDIRLYTIQGTLVRSQKSPGGKISLDVSNLPNGNYFLHIYKDSGAVPETHKIVIRH